MSGWTEEVKGWHFVETAEGTTGTRIFYEDPTGTDSLPKVGKLLGIDTPLLKSISISTKLIPHEENMRRRRVTVNYSTKTRGDGGGGGGDDTPAEDLPRSIDVGGEFLNVGKQPYASFEGGGPVDANRLVRITKAPLQIGKGFTSWQKIIEVVETYGGRVNSVDFDTVLPGKVLFLGVSANETSIESLGRRWQGTCQFEYRNPGWNFVWDPNTQTWRKVIPLTYEEADLNEVLRS